MQSDESPAKRIKDKYRGANIYLTPAFDDEGNPIDLHISISNAAINLDQNTLSNIDALAAMTSLALREFDPDYVAVELLRVARGPNTLPSIIANVILDHCVGK